MSLKRKPKFDAEVVMEPAFVTTEMWHDISGMLRTLWVYVFFIIGFALNLLIAHAIIPSLAGSGQISERIAKLRPVFYLVSAGALVFALAALVLFLFQVNVVVDVFAGWWI